MASAPGGAWHWLALAVVVHVGLLLMVGAQHAKVPLPESALSEVAVDLSLSSSDPQLPVARALAREPSEDQPSRDLRTRLQGPLFPRFPAPKEGTAGKDERLEPTASPSSSASPFVVTGAVPPGFSNEALALAGPNRFLVVHGGNARDSAGLVAPSFGDSPGKSPVERSIREALDARDHELGLDTAGPLLAFFEEATRPSDGPPDGRAVFDVVVNDDGSVREVQLTESSASRPEWLALRAEVEATLRSRSIPWRRKRRAWAARIEVTSRWALPSGATPGATPGFKGSSEGVTLGGFDVSDIGARPARSVHARILTEGPL